MLRSSMYFFKLINTDLIRVMDLNVQRYRLPVCNIANQTIRYTFLFALPVCWSNKIITNWN